MADVFVKHATPPSGLTLENAAKDLDERGGADAIVVSGSGTGAATDLDDVVRVRSLVAAPLYIGSGVTRDTVSQLLEVASGVIVGTDLKVDGVATNPVDSRRAAELIATIG